MAVVRPVSPTAAQVQSHRFRAGGFPFGLILPRWVGFSPDKTGFRGPLESGFAPWPLSPEVAGGLDRADEVAVVPRGLEAERAE